MRHIQSLSQSTINQIAAGEVVERPSSVVKELVENAIDAEANAVTVEIKDGGTELIRVTDNGTGILPDEVRLAFLRHATSKITSAEDLLTVESLGFRGEALASIASVAKVELLTKVRSSITGTRYCINGGEEAELEDVGCPDGTTFLVRELFYQTPARKKFLKSPMTEASYVGEVMERMALSHPEVAIHYINQGKSVLHTAGNGRLKDVIYHIYGREAAAALIEVSGEADGFSVTGYIGKPILTRGNRSLENYFLNGRYIKSSLIYKAIEEAYKGYAMQHRFPFTALSIAMEPELFDVNVHPAKLEVRFRQAEHIYEIILKLLGDSLKQKDLIPKVTLNEAAAESKKAEKPKTERLSIPEPFEAERRRAGGYSYQHSADKTDVDASLYLLKESAEYFADKPDVNRASSYRSAEVNPEGSASYRYAKTEFSSEQAVQSSTVCPEAARDTETVPSQEQSISTYGSGIESSSGPDFVQQSIFHEGMEAFIASHRVIGQVFKTYWLVELNDELYIIDQHAAHEKVLYERIMGELRSGSIASQQLSPPAVVSLSAREREVLAANEEAIASLGFEIEAFGGNEYSVTAVPTVLYGMNEGSYLYEMLNLLSDEGRADIPDAVRDRLASAACKAAVKGQHQLSAAEAEALIEQLLKLKNPFHCPHGRPTIISMSKYELEKKFKRIV